MSARPQRRNLFGFGAPAPKYRRKQSSATIPQASRAAFAAGKRLGDAGYFENWLERVGLDGRGAAVRSRLKLRFDEGVTARSLPGKDSGRTRSLPGKDRAGKGRKPKASTFKGYRIVQRADGEYSVPRLDAGSRFETPADARKFIASWQRGQQNPARLKRKSRFILTKSQLEDLALIAVGGGAAAPLARKLLKNPGRPGSAFQRCVAEVTAKGGAFDPRAVCAAAAREKYGEAKLEQMQRAGRQRAANRGKRRNPRTTKATYALELNGRPKRRNPTVKIGTRKVKVTRAGARVIRRLVAHDKLKPGRRNPEAESAEMYRLFHGKDADETVTYISEQHEHHTLWGAGDLVRMTVLTPGNVRATIDVAPIPRGEKMPDPSALPIGKRVVLAASEDGRQMYLVSGNQELDLRRLGFRPADERDNMVIGVIEGLVYQTEKDFHKFDLTNYTHRLGEESGYQPMLVYHPRTPQLEIVGGRYRIERPGIID